MKKIAIIIVCFIPLYAGGLTLPTHFKAGFTQMITNPQGKRIHYQGNVAFSNKHLLKWNYKKPTKKEVCIDKSDVVVVDHDLEQVSYYYIDKGFDFVKVMAEAKRHKADVYIAKYDAKQYTIQLDDKARLQSFAFFDELDNKVQVSFRKMRYGTRKLPVKRMGCKIPKSYDVIK